MKCPTCSQAFVRLPFLGVELDACPRGEWVWIGRGRLAPLYKTIGPRPSRKDLATLRKECAAREAVVTRAVRRGAVAPRTCPECGKGMRLQPLSSVSGIPAHCCNQHGFLLARKRFEDFVDFLARGGGTLAHQSLTRKLAKIREEAKAAERKETAGSLLSLLLPR